MTKVPNIKLRSGHAPDHVREAAGAAFEAWMEWDDVGAEPTVAYEVNYEPHQISISRACALVWNCSDIVPGLLFDQFRDCGIELERRTYAACAQMIVGRLRARKQTAA